jgi:hypothetical protein
MLPTVLLFVLLFIVCAQEEFISGHAFFKLAKWNADSRYKVNFSPKADLQDGDIISMNCGHRVLPQFLALLGQIPPRRRKFIFITQNCDHSFTTASRHQLEKHAKRIYATNNVCGEACWPLVHPLPIGFIDSRNHADKAHHVFRNVAKEGHAKEHLVFMNFLVKNNPQHREPCLRYFKDKPWVLHHESGLAPLETYTLTAKAKYVVSPPGQGIDCHRIYESMYLGAVPIVESSSLDYFYAHLPVIIVDSWTDVTEEFLQTDYEVLKKALDDWKTKYRNWTTAQFWLSGGDQGPFGEY